MMSDSQELCVCVFFLFLSFIYLCTRWRYVITGILEVNVKPSLHMWSWKRIKRHRQQVKQCKELYKTKITNKKPAETLLKKLEVNIGKVLSYGVIYLFIYFIRFAL